MIVCISLREGDLTQVIVCVCTSLLEGDLKQVIVCVYQLTGKRSNLSDCVYVPAC